MVTSGREWLNMVLWGYVWFPRDPYWPTFADAVLPLSSDTAPGSHLLLVNIEMI